MEEAWLWYLVVAAILIFEYIDKKLESRSGEYHKNKAKDWTRHDYKG